MKILLAGGDRHLVALTSYGLFRHGHHVISALTATEALQRWRADRPDLAVLDVALPHVDGLAVCAQIRQESQLPIIMLNGYDGEAALMRTFEAGADDCINKPFSVRQLLLRIDAVMRRVTGDQHDTNDRDGSRVEVGDLVIDPAAFEACKNGVSLRLTRLEFRILYRLAHSAGTLVNAYQLGDYAWQSPASGDSSLLKTHISHIRQKLEEAGGIPLQIRAIPRTGYILSAEARPATPVGGSVASALLR